MFRLTLNQKKRGGEEIYIDISQLTLLAIYYTAKENVLM